MKKPIIAILFGLAFSVLAIETASAFGGWLALPIAVLACIWFVLALHAGATG
jgi:hypothetical protein